MNDTRIQPMGWLLDFLKTQVSGLTGHIEKAGPPFNQEYWGATEVPAYNGTFWWPFEQTAYYIDGMTRTAILLEDTNLLQKAEKIIYSVINFPDADGYLGPKELKDSTEISTRWSHVVFFRACLALYEYNKDENIVRALTLHYLGQKRDYSQLRDVYNVEIMLELYKHNHNKALLDMAVSAYEQGHDNEYTRFIYGKSLKNEYCHGVSLNEYAKLGALLYRETGEKKYLDDSVRAYDLIKRKYLLVGGCNSSSEDLDDNRYNECYELCNISDMTWSLHYLADIIDDPQYSDMIENCIFNAGIGSVTEDFRALQYFSCANQIILNEISSHCRSNIGGKSMAYAPMPLTACCPGNMNRFMPNYVLSLWTVNDHTVTARMYGPSILRGSINGKPFCIEEKSNYPFELSAYFTVKSEANFTLRMRIPSWCTSFKINGKEHKNDCGYAVLNISNDTEFSVVMDADIVKKTNRGGVYFTRGPLVYSLGMKGNRTKQGDPDFPIYSMTADQKWNYAIENNCNPVYEGGEDAVWDVDCSLPTITVSAREVSNWRIRTKTKVFGINWNREPIMKTGKRWKLTPSLPRPSGMKLAEYTERIRLLPYGASKIRMTVLPKVPTKKQ